MLFSESSDTFFGIERFRRIRLWYVFPGTSAFSADYRHDNKRKICFFLDCFASLAMTEEIYFAGIAFNSSTKNVHHFSTVAISKRSSGECAPRIVGPQEIMSNFGFFSKNNPHSNPP